MTSKEISALGEVDLTIAAETTQEPFLDKIVDEYESRYPNVHVSVRYKSFEDHMATVLNTAAGANPPDLIEGNNGHAVDGMLVEAGLIRPLDDVAKVYGWLDGVGAKNLTPAMWTEDGSTFGTGKLFGISGTGEVLSLYYNADKLKDLNIPVPKDIGELSRSLPAIKAAGETPLILGNSDQWSATHIFSALAAQHVKAQDVRAWIGGKKGETFTGKANVQATQEIAEWVRAGYFNRDYNGINNVEARAQFAAGKGVFFIGGSWNGTGFQNVSAIHAAPLPQGGVGGLSQPWHISTSTHHLLPAVAFLAMMQEKSAAQYIADAGLLPLNTAGVGADSTLQQETIKNMKTVVAAGTTFGYYDYATVDMGTVMGRALQEAMAGRTTAEQFTHTVQKAWEKGRSKE
ncbi:ABC transporter substrate-binding protein [Streptomyces shenzhenensis]|uniref:ABC transporter substrate-binding protein n=1 Tax=Streptomyces shenzhenensis TaxID=943815 RepID=UPI003D8E31D1